jgi:bacillithiol synthase
LLEAYAAGGARAFFSAHYLNAEDRKNVVLRAAGRLSTEMLAAIRAQNAAFAPSASRERNLELLERGAAAVVTGQQMGLFLGPLFTVYKAATAIQVAKKLEEETGTRVVPIFWLQTEDHDLPEIACCSLPSGAGGPIDLKVPASPQDRVSVAHVVLPPELDRCLEILRGELSRLPHGPAHLDILTRHYQVGRGYVEAFAGVLAELFREEGLVLIDPRDPAIAAAAAPIHRRALLEAPALASVLLERSRLLVENGFAPMVHVRAGAPLNFYHPLGAEGPRYRLEPAGEEGLFKEVGGERVHRLSDLTAALDRDPRVFSSSALLRPIVQDSLLPTAAYIGGPGEVAYFAQLEPLYHAFELKMPLIVPRARFRIIEEKTLRLLARIGVSTEQAMLSEDALLSAARTLERAPISPLELQKNIEAQLDHLFDEVSSKIEGVGEGIDHAIEKTRVSIKSSVAKLREKYERAVLHRDQSLVEDVRRLKSLLQPNGEPQERVFGVSYYAARYGERAFVEKVLESIVVYDSSVKELRL